MKSYIASTIRNGISFTATMSEDSADRRCYEHVIAHMPMGGKIIHDAAFESANLGAASRDEYTRVMLASVADKFKA